MVPTVAAEATAAPPIEAVAPAAAQRQSVAAAEQAHLVSNRAAPAAPEPAALKSAASPLGRSGPPPPAPSASTIAAIDVKEAAASKPASYGAVEEPVQQSIGSAGEAGVFAGKPESGGICCF